MIDSTHGMGLVRRVLAEHRRIVIPLSVALVVNVLAYALIVYPLSQRVANVTQRDLAAEQALAQATAEHGQASGTLYEDAGDGWGFKRGEYRLTTYSASRENGAIVVKRAKADGHMPSVNRKLAVRVLTANGELRGTGTESDGVRVVPDEREPTK